MLLALVACLPGAAFELNQASVAQAQQGRNALTLWEGGQFLIDPTGQLTPDQALKAAFRPGSEAENFPTFGFTDSTVWMKVHFTDHSEVERFFLTIDHIYLSKTDLYVYQGTKLILHKQFGLDVPFSNEENQYYGYSLPIEFPKGVPLTLLLRAQSKYPISLPVSLFSTETYYQRLRTLDRIFWFYIGVISILIGYNLFLFFCAWDRAYLYYVATLFSLHLVANLAQYGVVRVFLFPNASFFHGHIFYFTHLFSTFFFFLFANRILRLEKFPVFRAVMGIQLFANAALFTAGMFVDTSAIDQAFQLNSSLFALCLLFVSMLAAYRGNVQALYFFLAWACLIVFWVITFLRIDGVVASNLFTNYSILLGAAIEGTLLSLALADRLRSLRREKEMAEKFAIQTSARTEIARQVAHDVRSPLAALEVVTRNLNTLPEEQRVLIRSATTRITDIMNDLLGDGTQGASAHGGATLISGVIDLLLTEKRGRVSPSISVDCTFNPSAYGVFAAVEPVEFRRVISNLLDNAIESVGDRGEVRVELGQAVGQCMLAIRDNGKGIPQEVLQKLGVERITHGKPGSKNGHGLGVFHAHKAIQKWGGTLKFQSVEGQGTCALVSVPAAPMPRWFAKGVRFNQGPVAIVDDDDSVHLLWKTRIQQVFPQAQVLGFHKPDDFRRWVREQGNRAFTALVDFEFTRDSTTGLDLIHELGVEESSYLVTSHFEDSNLQAQCERANVRIVPKVLAGIVPMYLVS